MSQETIEWLNNNVMLGCIKDREKYAKNNWMIMQADGSYKAWWQTDDYQHAYDGFIPAEEVQRVLFGWEPVECEVMLKMSCTEDDADAYDGNGKPFRWVPAPEHKAIVHPNGTVYSFTGVDTYQTHSYSEWLLKGPAMIVDSGELGINTAMLLRRGGVACVNMSLPESVVVEGLEFKPTLMAMTSHDTTKKTGYYMTNLIGVCDNSMNAAQRQSERAGKFITIKHTSKSMSRIHDIKAALGLVYQEAEEFSAWVEALCKVDITDKEFRSIIAGLVPVPEAEVGVGKSGDQVVKNQRSITIAANKNDRMFTMWKADDRCAPWHGTLFGAFQTFNTWAEQERPRNDNAIDRVMHGTISGQFDKEAEKFWSMVEDLELNPLVAS